MQNIIAVIFDFDDTLAPDSTSSFLEKRGLDVKNFWKSANQLLAQGWDPVPAYLYKFLQESQSSGKPITKTDLINHGKNLTLYNGVTRVFSRLENHIKAKNPDIKIEFYLISSGIGEVLRSTKIAKYFKDIWACDFHYDENESILFPKNVVSFTDKTRYLFQISKGFVGPESHSKPFEVNKKIKNDNFKIPFKNMIFVGDGYTDVPCFSLVKKNEGYAIGVYDQEHREKWGRSWGFTEEGRVSNLVPADYGAKSALSDSLIMAINSIENKIRLQTLTYQG